MLGHPFLSCLFLKIFNKIQGDGEYNMKKDGKIFGKLYMAT
jgi:hypothetical protein